ncbi:transposon Tn552 DNA-invertase binR [Candidatus Scalindua japonica]|uniref:Transposon Tn552 DNA-invertase binR n=1 Tax=Candidatus Scalindua japonica TaxID=1284222 RepID=A0A286TYE4_9BACT|nr:recombinase family protein [Candidatus Scalindua japonica]GAX60923.1 transposon Tn552 DNA-invertase binR [Candidatus Scalindua japonica]
MLYISLQRRFEIKKVGIYARVSTKDQSVDMQLNDLERYSKERGLGIFKVYKDNGVSGTKETRPALSELMNDAKKRKFDTVLVWRFDRFARSTKHLVGALHEFRNLGIDFISYQENIDTSSPLGEAIFTIISAMSKLERDIIAERVKGGLRKAKANGKKLGRPKNIVDTEKVIEYRKKNKSIRLIAKELNLSKGAVQRTLEMCL